MKASRREQPLASETWPSGAPTPLGSPQYPVCCTPGQDSSAPARHFRRRRCLLKGCERSYRPTHPQSRYCSDACRTAARRWRRRQASRTWRVSAAGKVRRRQQCRRYRRRLPLVVLAEPPPVSSPPLQPAPPAPAPPTAACEGQRPATFPQDFSVRSCQRPGCYQCFSVSSDWSPQRFCCGLCRQALRRVLDREARYRRRRRQGFRPPRRRPTTAPPPGS